jgi:DNA topoisomerase-1
MVRDSATLKRIRALAIPPAWADVWICPLPDGHLQATGRDARGRKQYRYHARWREVRDETKYAKMVLFGTTLPRIRAQVEEDLGLPGLPRNKLLAIIVRLLETTFIRVGNEEYARNNRSFGLTTLLGRHVTVLGDNIRFRFQGKSGKAHEVHLNDRRLARLVTRIRDLPGQDLFQYVDEAGEPQPINSADVNEYLRLVADQDFTAKDFRTWAGTLLAARSLDESSSPESKATAKAAVVAAAESVAHRLGNTAAICRKCYIHPSVLEAFQEPALFDLWEEAREGGAAEPGLSEEESALLRYLQASPLSGP